MPDFILVYLCNECGRVYARRPPEPHRRCAYCKSTGRTHTATLDACLWVQAVANATPEEQERMLAGLKGGGE